MTLAKHRFLLKNGNRLIVEVDHDEICGDLHPFEGMEDNLDIYGDSRGPMSNWPCFQGEPTEAEFGVPGNPIGFSRKHLKQTWEEVEKYYELAHDVRRTLPSRVRSLLRYQEAKERVTNAMVDRYCTERFLPFPPKYDELMLPPHLVGDEVSESCDENDEVAYEYRDISCYQEEFYPSDLCDGDIESEIFNHLCEYHCPDERREKWQEYHQRGWKLRKVKFFSEVSLYQHGLSRFYLGDTKVCQWGSGMVGYLVLSPWEVQDKETGETRMQTHEEMEKSAENLIKTVTQWANGDVHRITLREVTESGEEVDEEEYLNEIYDFGCERDKDPDCAEDVQEVIADYFGKGYEIVAVLEEEEEEQEVV